MSLTVREALSLDPLCQGALVAGQQGLDNQIRWVTIVEVLEDAARLQEGELLITTAYGLEQDFDRHSTYIDRLAERRLAGLVVVTGFYMEKIPAEMIARAEQRGLPVVALPPSVNFSDITRSVLQRIVNRQYELLHASESVHGELTALALGNGGLPEIAAAIARWTGGQVLFSDCGGAVLSHTGAAATATATAAKLARDAGETEPWETDDGSQTRLAIPIRASNRLYGYMILTKPTGTLRELDRVAAGHAATVSALLFMRAEAVAAAEQRLRGEFLDEVLAGGPQTAAALIEKARTFGCDFTRPHLGLTFSLQPADSDLLGHLYRRIDHTLQAAGRRFLLRRRSTAVIALLEADRTAAAADLAGRIVARWQDEQPEATLRAGIGNPTTAVAAFRQTAREADEAARLGHLLTPPRAVVAYAELSVYQIAAALQADGADIGALYRTCLGELAAAEPRTQELRQTLDAYLAHNANIQATARALFVHRHTLRYRLQRIEQITGRDLKNPLDRLQLHLGLMLCRFAAAQTTAPD